MASRGWICLSVALVACGSPAKSSAPATQTDRATIPSLSEPTSDSKSGGISVDALGNQFVLVSRVNGPGQRVDEAVFLDQVSKGPLVGPSGLTYGVIPAVPEGHLDEEQREAPDLLAQLDPNGTQTIVGFVLKAEYYDALTVSGDRTLYAVDGKTVVGVRRQLASAGGQISFRFEPAER